MPIAASASTRHATFDDVRLASGRFGNRIAPFAAGSFVALTAVIDKRDCCARVSSADTEIWNPVGRRTEVRVGRARTTHEIHIGIRL